MQEKPDIQEVTDFLIDYAAKMLSIGTYTARIDRCVSRIARAYGYDVSLTIFVKHFTISVMDPNDNSIRRTYVKSSATMPISFNLISELSALSWQIYDEQISLKRARSFFNEIISHTKRNFGVSLILMSFANSAFCKLFGGDIGSMASVFVATFIGFYLRHLFSKFSINLKIQYIIVSFISSFIAYLGVYLGVSNTPDVAIGSSILFLMPGVLLINSVFDILNENTLVGISRGLNTPDVAIGSSILFLMPGVLLINSVFDILNENTLVGISRGLNTGLLIICIAIGVYMTIAISNIELLNV